jgi:hypothetical protein
MAVTCPHGHEVKPAPYCNVCGAPLPSTDLSAADEERAQETPGEDGPSVVTTPPTRRPNRRLLILTAVVLLALLIGGGTYLGINQWTGSDSSQRIGPAPTSAYPSPTTSEMSPPQPTEQPPSISPTPSSPTTESSPTAEGPESTVEEYFDAINAGDYKRAWELGGKNIQGGSYSSFVQGFEDTAHDSVTIVSVVDETVEIELDATQEDGSHRYFAGTYTVRDGVIIAADIHPQ